MKRLEFSILEDYDKGEDLAAVERDFALFKELGVRAWRGSFGWDDYEPERGRYDFTWLHSFAALATTRGITLRPYIGYTPEWAAAGGTDGDVWNDPPRDLDAWYRFVRRLSADMRKHRSIVSYEIYNEENVRQWWDGSATAYRDVLQRGVRAVNDGNPDAEVLLGGMVFPDIEWLRALCEDNGSGRHVDVIPFHAYPETWTPPGVTVENYLGPEFDDAFVADADAACGRKRLWINETGYATTPGRTELDQARWWARAIATFAAQPRVEHIGIYEIRDLPPDRPAIGDAPNYHLGIVRATGEKKMAFGTLARLVALFNSPFSVIDLRSSVSTSPADVDVHRHAFRRVDGRQLLFVWTTDRAARVSVRLPRRVAHMTEFAVDGTPLRTTPTPDGRLPEIDLQAGEVKYFELR